MILGGYLSYAQFSDDAFVVRTVHIFPAEIEGDGWQNLETLTFQNLEEYALLQEFNTINSATMITSPATLNRLEAVAREAAAEEDTVIDTEDVVTSPDTSTPISIGLPDTATTSTTTDALESASATTTTAATSTPVFAVPDVTDAVADNNPPTDAVQSSTSEVMPEPETVEVESSAAAATTTVLRQVSSLFRLAVETVTTAIGSSSAATDTSPVANETESTPATTTPVTGEFQTISDVVLAPATTTRVEEPTLNAAESTTTIGTEVAPIAQTTSTPVTSNTAEATTTNVAAGTSSAPSSVADSTTDTQAESVATTSSAEPVAECAEECRPYVISLNNFAYPLDEGVDITGAQMRMSFAASKKSTRERTPLFSVSYSIDGGVTWQDSGAVVIDDEVSNSVNGGYYLFAIPDVTDQASLNNLQVELSYHDDPRILDELFVESVWLELFTVEPPTTVQQPPLAELLANDGYNPEPLSGDTLVLPNGKTINFIFTDDNTEETLIIKSDQKTYQGVSETTTYFSITNTSDKSDEIQVQTYFPNDVGEVTSLEVFNQNKPRQVVIPEYRPYVYHCEAGWEYAGEFEGETLADLSQQLFIQTTDATTTPVELPLSISTTSTATGTTPESEQQIASTTATTTVSTRLPNAQPLMQWSTSTARQTFTATSSQTDNDSTDAEDLVAGYACRNTNVVRQCDELDGDNTACRVNQVKVAEHEVTNYIPGWEGTSVITEALPEPGLIKRVASFIGFGPERKEVPAEFEPRVHTPDTFAIQPGETLYFKMDIAFPPFSTGEYWIEAVGDREYGLLDPFWSSQWTYRLPITIDNTASSDTLTEHQVFLELDSSLTDFWTNVSDDGGDIRFIQETTVGNLDTWYGTGWGTRTPITIQASQVDEDLTDFPVYVDLADLGSGFFSTVQDDGDDIRITESDGETELAYELVSIDTTGETGELHFNASFISSTTDTTFYIYHDNPNVSGYSETDTYGAQNVWGSEFIAVYHME
jgi:hypothetical protein